ncbi:GNAT family N-acetyltransferase [Alkalihalobacillus sp. CinArs1]|uniref:GNAT family N-acetyltransferase n=1 Tax=Alkalihalobacillus sp. CinArs1 TaxID=2995314 RepID=UPI0022DE9408|nr:GNAT family protein [Alkalihalobacillus sp. CinArs1]
MEIALTKLTERDAEDLFRFEIENRAYFEEMVPTRGEDYYKFDGFLTRHEALLSEQSRGDATFYLVRNQEGHIVGRMNISVDEKMHGDLGYRIGRDYAKGVAKQALKALMEEVKGTGVKRIHAKTTSNNIASQKVLEKNGFRCVGFDDESFSMNGEKMNFVYYMWSENN